MKLNSASFGVEVRDVHMRLMLGENLHTVPGRERDGEHRSVVVGVVGRTECRAGFYF